MMLNSRKKILATILFSIFTALLTASLITNWKSTNATSYLAPVTDYDHPNRVPGFIVHLRPDHSVEAHLAALATPNNVQIGKVLDWGNYIMYYIETDDESLDIIRADPGVERVVCNLQGVGVRSAEMNPNLRGK
jgi:hypothetical protein